MSYNNDLNNYMINSRFFIDNKNINNKTKQECNNIHVCNRCNKQFPPSSNNIINNKVNNEYDESLLKSNNTNKFSEINQNELNINKFNNKNEIDNMYQSDNINEFNNKKEPIKIYQDYNKIFDNNLYDHKSKNIYNKRLKRSIWFYHKKTNNKTYQKIQDNVNNQYDKKQIKQDNNLNESILSVKHNWTFFSNKDFNILPLQLFLYTDLSSLLCKFLKDTMVSFQDSISVIDILGFTSKDGNIIIQIYETNSLDLASIENLIGSSTLPTFDRSSNKIPQKYHFSFINNPIKLSLNYDTFIIKFTTDNGDSMQFNIWQMIIYN